MAAWLLVWFCWGMGIGQVAAQYKTDFLLTGLQNEQLKTSVEQSLTALLTEFNTAQAAGRSLQWDVPALQGKLSEQAIASLRALWANSPFRCTETEVIEKCLQTPSGYQVRNDYDASGQGKLPGRPLSGAGGKPRPRRHHLGGVFFHRNALVQQGHPQQHHGDGFAPPPGDSGLCREFPHGIQPLPT